MKENVIHVRLAVSQAELLPLDGEDESVDKRTTSPMLFIPAGMKGRVMTASPTNGGLVLVNWDWAQLGSTVNQYWEWFVKPEHLVFERVAEQEE